MARTAGYSVGRKSGAAHRQIGRGYASNKYRARFTGLAPVEKTRIVVGVIIDDPSDGKYFGGIAAAPVFSEVVQQTLRLINVAPDLPAKAMILTTGVPESF
ncbi:Penicillin-binding protein 2 [compost metagenome]